MRYEEGERFDMELVVKRLRKFPEQGAAVWGAGVGLWLGKGGRVGGEVEGGVGGGKGGGNGGDDGAKKVVERIE